VAFSSRKSHLEFCPKWLIVAGEPP